MTSFTQLSPSAGNRPKSSLDRWRSTSNIEAGRQELEDLLERHALNDLLYADSSIDETIPPWGEPAPKSLDELEREPGLLVGTPVAKTEGQSDEEESYPWERGPIKASKNKGSTKNQRFPHLLFFSPKILRETRLPKGIKRRLKEVQKQSGLPLEEKAALELLPLFYNLLRQSTDAARGQRYLRYTYKNWARVLGWTKYRATKAIRALESAGILFATRTYQEGQTWKRYSFRGDVYKFLAEKDRKLVPKDLFQELQRRLRWKTRELESGCLIVVDDGGSPQPYPRASYRGMFQSLTRIIVREKRGQLGNEHVHHTCHNPACIQESHLEIKGGQEHLTSHQRERWGKGSHNRRKTHCPRKHRYSGRDGRNYRICRICDRNRKKAERQIASGH